MAASATLALNSGLYCFRFLLMVISFQVSDSELNTLSSFWGPPHVETWKWLEKIGFRQCLVAENPVHRALVMLLEAGSEFSSSEPTETLLLARALEGIIGSGGPSVGSVLKERIGLILGIPSSHKGWLKDFYRLRSQIAHGDYILLRNGVATEEQRCDYSKKFWAPLDRARAVLLALLQRLIIRESKGYKFEELVDYI
jgi:hypothetical protein